ncbi:MAG: type II toxin-antitoxin system HicA family toxin [Rhodospirillaceae bacterium]|nr:type II toxin-antitoxin system HicA family toxin [Rhodospirillaceae bacterium]
MRDSKDIIRRLERAGWVHVRTRGSHWIARHPERPGTVTVPHPRKDLTIATIKSIEKQSGVSMK